VIGVQGDAFVPLAVKAVTSPKSLADQIKADGKSAGRRFGLRVGLVVLGGGAAGGFAMALVGMRARRIFQGAAAGVIVVAILGVIAWQTYDIDAFSKVQFTSGSAVAPALSR
jgi:4-hydroxybenzoate polyprenyltransferase